MSVIDVTNPNSSNSSPFFSYFASDAVMRNNPFLTADREGKYSPDWSTVGWTDLFPAQKWTLTIVVELVVVVRVGTLWVIWNMTHPLPSHIMFLLTLNRW